MLEDKQKINDRYRALADAEFKLVDKNYNCLRSTAVDDLKKSQSEYDSAKIASMQTAKLGGVVPVGGRVRLWAKRPYQPRASLSETEVVGVVEVCTRESQFPANQSYRLPSVGDLFIRILKKDGTPSIKFVSGWTFDGKMPYGWYPEGVTPK